MDTAKEMSWKMKTAFGRINLLFDETVSKFDAPTASILKVTWEKYDKTELLDVSTYYLMKRFQNLSHVLRRS
jgi:hypothetical protein